VSVFGTPTYSPIGAGVCDDSMPAPRVLRPVDQLAPSPGSAELHNLALKIVSARDRGEPSEALLYDRFRRLRELSGPTTRQIRLTGRLVLDLDLCIAWANDCRLQLSPAGWRVLLCLVRADRRLCSHRELRAAGWGEDMPETKGTPKSLTMAIGRLRLELTLAKWDTGRLVTIPNRGYLLDVEGES
jgi:DNA-binding response OmpR family regulator